MAERYWMQPAFQQAVGSLSEPSIKGDAWRQVFDNQPSIMSQRVPEWYWFDADGQELRLNVHQAYFEIADAGRAGGSLFRSPEPDRPAEESFFNTVTDTGQSEWTSMVLSWGSVFTRLGDDNRAVHRAAGLAVNELDSIVDALSLYRFDSGSRTPQLIGPLFGSLTAGGIMATALSRFFAEQCMSSGHEEVGVTEATAVIQGLGKLLTGTAEGEGIGDGVSISADGRFVSNTGVVVGTGSLEVLPTYTENPFYSSHNLDSALTQLWAFAGLARLVGEAHRHYDQQAAAGTNAG